MSEAAAASELVSAGPELASCVGNFCLKPGDRVVFTGEPPGMSRHELEARSEKAGIRVTASVSRLTRLLVAADADSLSGKARRARELGIPIVDVGTYLRMLDEVESA